MLSPFDSDSRARKFGMALLRCVRRARRAARTQLRLPQRSVPRVRSFETGGLRPAFCRRARWARGGGGAGRAYVVSSPGLRELELTVLATVGEPWSLNLTESDRSPVRARVASSRPKKTVYRVLFVFLASHQNCPLSPSFIDARAVNKQHTLS